MTTDKYIEEKLKEFWDKFCPIYDSKEGEVTVELDSFLRSSLLGLAKELREEHLAELMWLKEKCGNYTWINQLIESTKSLLPSEDKPNEQST